MIRNKFAAFAVIAASALSAAAQQSAFPIVNIQGRPYYYYEVKKGDSLYGISKSTGWDEQVIRDLNPTAVLNLKRGARIYYPVSANDIGSQTSVKAPVASVPSVSAANHEPIRHIVRKGDNVYSIARQYGVPTDLIYFLNPSARTGIESGQVIVIDPAAKKDSVVMYEIKEGDTPYSVAQQFNSSVEDIFRENPGVNDRNFKPGSTLRVLAGTDAYRVRTENVKTDKLDNFAIYKVGSDESWEGIARKNGITAVQLREANPGIELKKGATITIPRYKQVNETVQYVVEDPREKTEQGRMEIFEDVKASMVQTPGSVNAVILLDAPGSKKDLEFTRGFITAVDRYKNSGFKINLNVLRGNREQAEIISDLDSIHPNLIVTTTDRELPSWLASYTLSNYAMLVNAFDLRSPLYRQNPSVVQFMPPTEVFNDKVTDYLYSRFPERKIVVVTGDADSEEDALSSRLSERFGASSMLQLTADELMDYPFYDTEKYLVYVQPSKKSAVARVLDILTHAREEAPGVELAVVGRPGWITFADALKDKMYLLDVYIPSRFYLDMDAMDSKDFLKDYARVFRHPPLKSYPVYAAVGYDVADFFLPQQAFNHDNYLAVPQQATPQLQIDVELLREPSGGFLNDTGYMIRYSPLRYVEKIRID